MMTHFKGCWSKLEGKIYFELTEIIIIRTHLFGDQKSESRKWKYAAIIEHYEMKWNGISIFELMHKILGLLRVSLVIIIE